MTPFQYVAIGSLGTVLAAELVHLFRTPGPLAMRLFRCLVWSAAALAIAFPRMVQAVAELLGIARGADVVFYLAVLSFLGASFYFYARVRRQQQQITDLVRCLAILDARRGAEPERGSHVGNGTPLPSGN